MTLDSYLRSKEMTPGDFAALIGASASGVTKWLRGERRPRPGMYPKIIAATDGAVRPNDFFADEAP